MQPYAAMVVLNLPDRPVTKLLIKNIISRIAALAHKLNG
jgi:hypothetical protein